MLRTNLSTRPFYNERAVLVVLGLFGLLVLAATVYNVTRLAALSSRQAVLAEEAASARRRTESLRQEAARIRGSVDQARLRAVAAAADEANTLIDGRTFSWTELFNRFEATLPPNVRIAGVRRRVDQSGRMVVVVAVNARSVEDIDRFIEALEETGSFENLLSRTEQVLEDDLLEASLEGVYVPSPHKGNVP